MNYDEWMDWNDRNNYDIYIMNLKNKVDFLQFMIIFERMYICIINSRISWLLMIKRNAIQSL